MNVSVTTNDLEWSKLVGCTTDGAPVMLAEKIKISVLCRSCSNRGNFFHCFIHRFTLHAKVGELFSCL